MPYGLDRRLVSLGLVTLVVVMCLGVAAPAFASLDDTPTVLSATNPSKLDGDETSWRWGWGNTLIPQVTIENIPMDVADDGENIRTDGIFYTLTQSPLAIPSALSPHMSATPNGSMLSGTFDVYAAMDELFGFDPTRQPSDCEGMWYFRWRFYNQFRLANPSWMLPLGIDMTDPNPVNGLVAGVTGTTVANDWTSETRRVVRWTPDAYDGLAGVGGFDVSVNGRSSAFVRNVAPDWDIEPWAASVNPINITLPQVSMVTIEDLPAGNNTIGITVVDRATNRSVTRYVAAKIDPDVPTVAITKPIATGVGSMASLEASATDAGGIQSVVFEIDGTVVNTDTEAPYACNVSMVPFGSGNHALKVTVTDMMGRTATDERTITVDATAPVLSAVSAGPSPFYPLEDDDYRDSYFVLFSANEPVTAVLDIRAEDGSAYRRITKNASGASFIEWDGESETGGLREGAFDWTLTVVDSAGNPGTPEVGSASIAVKATPPTMTSTTNPGDLNDPNADWRWNWGNSFNPQVTITGGNSDAQGIWYLFDQQESNTPPVGGPNLSASPSGTMFTGTIDLPGIMDETGWTQQTGATKRGEGWWFFHYRFYNQFGAQPAVWNVPLGIDVTAPGPVENLSAGVTSTQATTGWTTATRRIIKWSPKAYDSLAGVGGFSISVNGTEKAFVKNVAPDWDVEWWAPMMNAVDVKLPQVSTVTLEDLPAGTNKIGITVVDRATNRSETRYVYANIDSDAPAIAMTSPSSNLVGKSMTISATPTDIGGVKSVVFMVDGKVVATDTTAPYSVSVDMTAYGSGSHTVTAVVHDMMDRTATSTKTVTCDITSPSLSIISKGPSPFYPKKRNGYRDDYIIKLASSETATAKLVFKTSKGTTFKTIVKTVPAGTSSIKWNGKSGKGNFKEGTYRWTLYLTDAAGNTSVTTSGSATERFYQLKRISKSKVKLVLR